MPHFVLDCSASILTLVEPQRLMQKVYEMAETSGLFARAGAAGIKVRLNLYQHFLNVDGQQHFVHVFTSLMEGRTVEQKKALSESIVRALKELLPTVEILSMNIRDFEKSTYCNATMLDGPKASG